MARSQYYIVLEVGKYGRLSEVCFETDLNQFVRAL